MIRGLLFVMAICLLSCDFFNKNDDILLASVYGEDLFFKDLEYSFDHEINEKDSLLLLNSLIEKWVKNQALVYKAKLNLDDQLLDISNQVEDYKNSLLIYRYQKLLLDQKLDTNVSELELRNFFLANKSNFKIKNDVAIVNYVKVKKEVPSLWKLLKWYKSDSENKLELLEDYCYQFADQYSINSDWIEVNNLIDKLPSNLGLKSSDFRKKRNHEYQDEFYYYFVHVKKYKKVGEIAPFELELEQIKNILINKRKLDFLKNMENSLYQEALSKNLVKYEKK